jgi:hypothetical protein
MLTESTIVPWYVNTFLKLVNPFIDPITKSKIKTNEPLPNHVPASQLMKSSGGDVDFKYDHSVYWPALEKLVNERRQQRKERWETAGKIIGENEIYLWGGDEPSLNSGKTETAAANEQAEAVESKDAAAPAVAGDASGAELVDGVEKLGIKESEPVKATA